MSEPILAEVGRHYLVPCLRVLPSAYEQWMPADGWVPVLGPKHRDAEHLQFYHEHYHVDWRFIDGYRAERACQRTRTGSPLASVVTNTGHAKSPGIVGSPRLRAKRCFRLMPDFPQIALTSDRRSADAWARLERAQAITCNRLKPGNVCPHRGIDLTPFVKDDGTVICPGHGLRWDTKTGAQLPYQTP